MRVALFMHEALTYVYLLGTKQVDGVSFGWAVACSGDSRSYLYTPKFPWEFLSYFLTRTFFFYMKGWCTCKSAYMTTCCSTLIHYPYSDLQLFSIKASMTENQHIPILVFQWSERRSKIQIAGLRDEHANHSSIYVLQYKAKRISQITPKPYQWIEQQ
jgi:hypothetical protein